MKPLRLIALIQAALLRLSSSSVALPSRFITLGIVKKPTLVFVLELVQPTMQQWFGIPKLDLDL